MKKHYILIIISIAAVLFSGFKLIGCETATYANYLWLGLIAAAVLVGGDAFVELKNTKK